MDIYQIAKLKPNTKPSIVLVGDEIHAGYEARVGRHPIKCTETGATWFATESEALAAATKFRDSCRTAAKKEPTP